MSAIGKRAIEERIRIIADWRREREMQDMLGLGPEAAQRSRRSADGLVELADAVAKLADDARIEALERHAFSGEMFVPGATVLEELGRFRFHDPEQEIDVFISQLVDFAKRDQEEMGLWGGPQIAGDNPWGIDFVISMEDDDDDW